MHRAATTAVELDGLHRYWLDGRELDGCTSTLAAVGLIDSSRYTDEARERGSYVHECIHADLDGELAEETVMPDRFGYLLAARAFIRDSGLSPLTVERPLADTNRWIAGKPDVIGLIDSTSVVLDWKTGGEERCHQYQSSWYEHLARVNGLVGALVHRMAVYLREDGTYITQRHRDRSDWLIAQAAITIVQAKRLA
jgi:hypothetical protein